MSGTTLPAPATTAATTQAPAPVSAVVLSWNRQAMLRDCLRSLRAQRTPAAEVIVVDNGSTDGSPAMVAEEFPEVRLIQLTYDTGIEGFNVGVVNARHEFVLLLDDDSALAPDWIEQVWTLFQQEPPTTAIISSVVIEPGMPEAVIAAQRDPAHAYLASFMGGASMVRRGAFVDTGLYRRQFFLFGNERDMAARLLNRGLRIRQCPTAIVHHKRGYGVQLGRESLYYHIRNNLWYVAMYYPVRDIVGLGGSALASMLGLKRSGGSRRAEVGLRQMFRELGHGSNWLVGCRALWDALRGLPWCLRHRAVCRHQDFSTIL